MKKAFFLLFMLLLTSAYGKEKAIVISFESDISGLTQNKNATLGKNFCKDGKSSLKWRYGPSERLQINCSVVNKKVENFSFWIYNNNARLSEFNA